MYEYFDTMDLFTHKVYIPWLIQPAKKPAFDCGVFQYTEPYYFRYASE